MNLRGFAGAFFVLTVLDDRSSAPKRQTFDDRRANSADRSRDQKRLSSERPFQFRHQPSS
jgi:hypothetical protein